MTGKLAVKITAMARCPIQHGGNGEAATVKVRLMWGHFYGFSFLSFGISSLIRWRKRPAAMGQNGFGLNWREIMAEIRQ